MYNYDIVNVEYIKIRSQLRQLDRTYFLEDIPPEYAV